MEELHKILEKYPHTKINGSWRMIAGEPTLQELRAGRERKLSLRGSK
jgi:hypothetical protein